MNDAEKDGRNNHVKTASNSRLHLETENARFKSDQSDRSAVSLRGEKVVTSKERSHEQTDQSQAANSQEDAGLQKPKAIVCSEAAEARVWKTMTRRDKSNCLS